MHTTLPAPVPSAVVINEQLHIPVGITDLNSFRHWAHSDDFPEEGRISWIDGTLWIDTSMEQAFSHNDVKHEVASVLRTLVKVTSKAFASQPYAHSLRSLATGCSAEAGRYFGDGMRLSHPRINLSTDPDGMFVLFSTLQSGRLRQVPGTRGGVVEFEGSPDMVLEVVSDTSVEKDNILLPPLYQAAGIQEFWRIDARGELRFEILCLTQAGYAPTRLADGWWRSDVFGRDFLLTQGPDPMGQPQFTLQVRP